MAISRELHFNFMGIMLICRGEKGGRQLGQEARIDTKMALSNPSSFFPMAKLFRHCSCACIFLQPLQQDKNSVLSLVPSCAGLGFTHCRFTLGTLLWSSISVNLMHTHFGPRDKMMKVWTTVWSTLLTVILKRTHTKRIVRDYPPVFVPLGNRPSFCISWNQLVWAH